MADRALIELRDRVRSLTEARCETCVFWAGFRHGNQLTAPCRAHPPAYSSVRKSIWPETRPDDWCGEYAANDRALTALIEAETRG